MYSLYCAREQIERDFLLLESDLVYEPRALEVLLSCAHSDAVLISGRTNAGDEVYVQAPGGRLEDMSKDAGKLASIEGELVGISRISLALYLEMCELGRSAFQRSLQVAYETDTLVDAASRRTIHCPLVADLLWGEIDDASHLARVREKVYPALQALSRATEDAK